MPILSQARPIRAVLAFALLGGCAGNIADHVGPREGIVTAELTRYGLNLRETQCVATQLANSLTPLQLRRLQRAAASVKQGYYDPDRLTPRDLEHVGGTVEREVGAAVAFAAEACRVATETAPAEPPPEPEKAPPPPNWLNLGKAESGQGMAIDASTIEREGNVRRAWFRMSDAGGKASEDIFLLQVDCAAKTIDPRERRKLDAGGKAVETVPYPNNPLPIEEGTVMAIAYLSLCA